MNPQLMKGIPAYGFRLPCPARTDKVVPLFDWDHISEKLIFEVVQQKQVEGLLQTVIRCPYCGDLCRFSLEEISKVVAYIRENITMFSDLQKEVIEIAFNGYGISI